MSKRPRGREPVVPPDKRDELVGDYRAGMPVKDMTAKWGVSRQRIYQLLAETKEKK
jgi:hypothetical protein